jgi:hypothetical protein
MEIRHGAGFRRCHRHRKETAMNACLRIAAPVLCVLGLAACAGTQEKSAYVPPRSLDSLSTDDAYVSNVENMARRRGVKITWVNVPRHASHDVR